MQQNTVVFECFAIAYYRYYRRRLKSEDIINEKTEHNDIFKGVQKQKVIVTLFSKLLEIRQTILNEKQSNNPSILENMLKNRYHLQKCIVSGSFGN